MTISIFFDLETSDRNPMGQILNYCFLAVDKDFSIIAECKGLVRLSRLELPDPLAILANRIAVLDHQNATTIGDNELAAVGAIRSFIDDVAARQNERVPLIGYNSLKFDIPYLRTTFIRNGANPYFYKKVVCRDLLHAVQKAFVAIPEFAELLVTRGRGSGKLSLRLETVAQALGLLRGEQAHESEFDVKLTIEVARLLARQYGIDVRTLELCEVARFHDRGPVVLRTVRPCYDLTLETRTEASLLMLLTNDQRSSLWVDLKRYEEGKGRQSIRWLSANRHSSFVEGEVVLDETQKTLAQRAGRDFKGITLRNYFEKSVCDIEQDIYRIDFDGIRILGEAILGGDDKEIRILDNRDLRILYSRHKLRIAPHLGPRGEEVLRGYAVNRYGGKALLSKSVMEGQEPEYHETLSHRFEILRHTRSDLATKDDQRSVESVKLLNQVEKFILDSEIVKVAGKELLPDNIEPL